MKLSEHLHSSANRDMTKRLLLMLSVSNLCFPGHSWEIGLLRISDLPLVQKDAYTDE